MSTQYDFKETCPKRAYWCSFRLVDEHGSGTPYAGLNYMLHDRQGQQYSGTLDGDGFARLENFYCGPLLLDLSTLYQGGMDDWYDQLKDRRYFKLPLTALQVAAEQSPRGPRDENGRTYLAGLQAEKEDATLFRVEVRDFVAAEGAAHLPESDPALKPRPSAFLKEASGAARPGIALMVKTHHVLEVKALRAYTPMLSRDKAFCALNAYHLALMTVLSYAPFNIKRKPEQEHTPPPYRTAGSIGRVLQAELGHHIKPMQFEVATPYHLLCEEVPYSKRLEIVPYDPARYKEEAQTGWQYPEQVHFLNDANETQAFITHTNNILLISIRGTAGTPDIVRDIDARQVPHEDGTGQAHRGFHQAFAACKDFIDRYMEAFYNEGQTILVCGHSLGGAIALLLAEWLRKKYSDDIQLYSFGAPRAGDSAFVKSAAGLTHHRLVNHNDPIPSVPSTWMDAEWKMALPGTVMLIASIGSPALAITLLLGGLLNLSGDNYEHHGEQWHFMPRVADGEGFNSVLWQPGCAAIDQKTCAEFAGDIDLQGDMPKRKSLLGQALSAAEHSSSSGYSRSALTTLLRWLASVTERDGDLFTDSERQSMLGQLKPLQTQLAAPSELTFNRLRDNLRTRTHPRLNNLTDLQLRTLFDDGAQRLEALRREQHEGLTRTQKRLLAQNERPLRWKDIFGDVLDSEELRLRIDDWLMLEANLNAARLAQVIKASQASTYS